MKLIWLSCSSFSSIIYYVFTLSILRYQENLHVNRGMERCMPWEMFLTVEGCSSSFHIRWKRKRKGVNVQKMQYVVDRHPTSILCTTVQIHIVLVTLLRIETKTRVCWVRWSLLKKYYVEQYEHGEREHDCIQCSHSEVPRWGRQQAERTWFFLFIGLELYHCTVQCSYWMMESQLLL